MTDAINPKHYQFPGGVQTIDITENLNGNGAQAAEYIIRSTRLDGNNKAETAQGLIEDLRKAIWFAEREIKRLGGVTNDAPIYVTAEELGLSKPRVWANVYDIPVGVHVTDADGDHFSIDEGRIKYRTDKFGTHLHRTWAYDNDKYAPFKEVLSV